MNKVEICGISTSSLPKITAKECGELMKLAKAGDAAAKDKLVMGNLRLVLSLIKKFSGSVNADDLFQSGVIGLIKAVDNFDDSFNVRFSTYAVPMILGEIKRVVRTKTGMRVARSIRDTAYKVLKTRSELEARDKTASAKDIADKLNINEKDVNFALDAISDNVSIFDPVYNKQGDTILLLDQIADQKNTDENWTEKICLEQAMDKLGERERRIIYLRYYEGKTQTEISGEVGLSQAQISRLEKNALGEIKKKISV
ncbi:MAG: sigma-70 family RNA polymerase sigma factor [Clostridia bacterium]|nr:sigma-70 family RNA polymerase sigma factor [Clostridia bacterium]